MTFEPPSFKQYLVEEEREVFFTFGRMNPPTVGHGKVMNALSAKAGRNPYKVYLSQSQDARKNPLSYESKIKHTRKMFPKHSRNIILDKGLRNVFEVASSLYDQGYNKLTMVVGSDRTTEFKTLLDKYNGVKGRHGFYNFEKINIVSAGERDPDASGVEGMSASKQRENAKNNNFTAFAQGIPNAMSNPDAKRLFNDVRQGMGLKESSQFKNHIELKKVSDIREKYVEGSLFEEGDRVLIRSTDKEGHVHRLGANYVIVALDEGRVSRCWLEDIQKIEEDTLYDIRSFFDRHKNKKKYQRAVRLFLDMRKKNPGQSNMMLRKVGQMTGLDIREIDRVLRDMVKQGAMPKHLLNYPSIQKPVREETYSPQKHEWGTDASTSYAKKLTPGQQEGVRQDSDIKDRKGTQPAKYHSGLSKAQKIARDRQFKKQTKMRDDDPRAYKPAAGDKTAKTKTSKYTTAYRRMFGEDAVARAKEKIEREKEADKVKHDKMMDRARIRKARQQNRETNPRESSNPVAKNLNKFNKPATHRDRKKDNKRGYVKHKGKKNEI